MALNPCKYEVTTTFGELLIVDRSYSFEAAEDYCEQHSSILLPATKQSIINETLPYLVDCNETDRHGLVTVKQRYGKWWTVGLKTENGVGNWSNGEVYDKDKHEQLFAEYSKPKWDEPCEEAYLRPVQKLLRMTANCDSSVQQFLCWRNSSFSTTTTTTTEQTKLMTENDVLQETSPQSFYKLIAFLSTICAMSILLNIVLIAKKMMDKRRNKKERNLGMIEVYNNPSANLEDSNVTGDVIVEEDGGDIYAKVDKPPKKDLKTARNDETSEDQIPAQFANPSSSSMYDVTGDVIVEESGGDIYAKVDKPPKK